MKSAYASKVPDRQFRTRLSGPGQRRVFADEALKQGIHGNAKPLGLGIQARFDLT
jgi:hypothetical protein